MAHYTAIARSPQALGRALAEVRTARGLTQEEIAETLGISRQYVVGIESGNPNLYASRVFEVIRELGGHIELHAEIREDGPDA